jgi:hypothetical protein
MKVIVFLVELFEWAGISSTVGGFKISLKPLFFQCLVSEDASRRINNQLGPVGST